MENNESIINVNKPEPELDLSELELDEANNQEQTRMMFALSTIDNPFNPFDDFWSWRQFDIEQEYFCCEYLARVVNETDDMTELEKIKETERAIDEIIALNPNPIYIKVSKEITL